MGPDRAGRDRVVPVVLVVSPGEMARGMGSALAAARLGVLRDSCPAPGWSSLYHPERDVSVLTPEDRRMESPRPAGPSPLQREYEAISRAYLKKKGFISAA